MSQATDVWCKDIYVNAHLLKTQNVEFVVGKM